MTQAHHRPAMDGWAGDAAAAAAAAGRSLHAAGATRTLVALASLTLAATIVGTSLVAYLADAHPELALRLKPSDATALLNIADRKLEALLAAKQTGARDAAQGAPARHVISFANPALNRILPQRLRSDGRRADAADGGEAPQPGTLASEQLSEIEAIRSLAERALASDPRSARALRILGQAAEEAGDQPRAVALMRRAAELNKHESGAVRAMMAHSFSERDSDETLRYADVLMRTRPAFFIHAVPILAQMIETGNAQPAIVQRLEDRPPWRTLVLTNLMSSITDARTPLALLTALKSSRAPPTDEELAAYLHFLVQKGFHELAYYAWLQFLPPERLGSARLVFNGTFDGQPTGAPFDWAIQQGTGVTVDIAPTPDEEANRGLRVAFGAGRVHMAAVTQLLMLPPGQYALSYRFRGDLVGRRGLKWVLSCATNGATHLGETSMFVGQQRSWRRVDLAFTVPEQGCRSQQLRLVHDSRSTSEEFASGTIWYDDVEIARLPEKPSAAAR